MKKHYLFLLISTILFSCNKEQPADFLIQNGTIIDGLGNPAFKADLLIRNGTMKLVEHGESVRAIETIDATGLIVSSGFIDVHNHTDQSINDPSKKLNEGFVLQGVGTNVAFYVRHNGIRRAVMNDEQRPPTSDELEQMKAMVREGMEMGAVGFSTGLKYTLGMFSNIEEVIALAKEVAPYNGIYDSHIRNPTFDWIGSNEEVIEIGRKAKIPAKMGHLKTVGLINEGKTEELFGIVKKTQEEGVNVVSDQYPYDTTGGNQTLRKMIIPTEDKEFRNRFNNDQSISLKEFIATPELKNKVKDFTENGINGGFAWIKALGYTSLRIVNSPDFPSLEGRYIVEIANEQNKHPFDLICELLLSAKHPILVKGGIREEDVQAILVQPWNMVASDGLYAEEDDPKLGHPRSTGTFPRVLGRYFREQKLLSLEEVIRKMTSFPADFIGLPSRGRIANDLPADITIFNPETITDLSTYLEPNIYSKGVIHVF